MLQISNLDDGKTEWNLNEAHIIIPMIDGDVIPNKEGDKISKNTITLNALDGTEQNILTNAVEHTLVIGLDRSIFDTYNNKGDLLVIQNSDLKLLPSTSDPKNSISYTLSFIDQPKNDILWDNSSIREKTKAGWGNESEKQVGIKDVLTYNETVQDSSKSWQECTVVKNNQPILLEGISNMDVAEQLPKIVEATVPQSSMPQTLKKSQKDSHFIVGYYPTIQACDALSVIPEQTDAVLLKNNKNVKNDRSVLITNEHVSSNANLNQLLEPNIEDNWSHLKWMKCDSSNVLINGSRNDNVAAERRGSTSVLKINQSISHGNLTTKMTNSSLATHERIKPVITTLSTPKEIQIGSNAASKECTSLNTLDNQTHINPKVNERSSLPEKSLPLKKKAKMKRTAVGSFNFQSVELSNVSLLKKEVTSCSASSNESTTDLSLQNKQPKDRKGCINKNGSVSDSNELIVKSLNKEKKTINFKRKRKNNDIKGATTSKQRKIRPSKKKILRAPTNITEPREVILVKKDKQEEKRSKSNTISNSWESKIKKDYKTIFDVVEDLKRKRYINNAVSEILISGLTGIKVDILKEISRNESKTPKEYSNQLKAFALMVHFKQPAAFNHLRDTFGKGWPPLPVIKEWKRQLNVHRKPLRKNSSEETQENVLFKEQSLSENQQHLYKPSTTVYQ